MAKDCCPAPGPLAGTPNRPKRYKVRPALFPDRDVEVVDECLSPSRFSEEAAGALLKAELRHKGHRIVRRLYRPTGIQLVRVDDGDFHVSWCMRTSPRYGRVPAVLWNCAGSEAEARRHFEFACRSEGHPVRRQVWQHPFDGLPLDGPLGVPPEIPKNDQWVQIGGDASPETYGAILAYADGQAISVLKIEAVTDLVGEREAAEVGFPFWTQEGDYDAGDLDLEGTNRSEILNALRSVDWTEAQYEELDALGRVELLASTGGLDAGSGGFSAAVLPAAPERIKWWAATTRDEWRAADLDYVRLAKERGHPWEFKRTAELYRHTARSSDAAKQRWKKHREEVEARKPLAIARRIGQRPFDGLGAHKVDVPKIPVTEKWVQIDGDADPAAGTAVLARAAGNTVVVLEIESTIALHGERAALSSTSWPFTARAATYSLDTLSLDSDAMRDAAEEAGYDAVTVRKEDAFWRAGVLFDSGFGVEFQGTGFSAEVLPTAPENIRWLAPDSSSWRKADLDYVKVAKKRAPPERFAAIADYYRDLKSSWRARTRQAAEREAAELKRIRKIGQRPFEGLWP